MPKLVILGAGISGASVFYHMKRLLSDWEVTILERSDTAGGLNRTFDIEGMKFSLGSRYIFNLNEYTETTAKGLATLGYQSGNSVHSVFYKGKFLKFPVQLNSAGLPFKDRLQCAWGLLTRGLHDEDVRTFEDWAFRSFGKGIANKILLPHVTKCWRVDPSQIDYQGVHKKIMFPSIGEMLWGAIRDRGRKGISAENEFLYPVGGINHLINEMLKNNLGWMKAELNLNTFVRSLDINSKRVQITREDEGSEVLDLEELDRIQKMLRGIKYDYLVSSIPLPGLVNLLLNSGSLHKDHAVVLASEMLHFNVMASIMLAFEGEIDRDDHFLYVPEKKYRFSRISFPKNFDSTSCPDGHTSMLVEVSFNKEQKKLLFRKDYQEALVRRVLVELDDLFPLISDKLIGYKVGIIDPAYIITDENYIPATECIRGFLEANGIYTIGRFGKWDWSRTEDIIPQSRDIVYDLMRKET